jgi:cyclophilin family peptidyl-prolyl cis-trans isomerase/protein-disulfide isomerase
MRKMLAILPLFYLCALAACSGQAFTTPTPPPIPIRPTMAVPTRTNIGACQGLAVQPTPNSGQQSIFPQAGKGDYDKLTGAESAPVTLTVYCDFQSTACAGFMADAQKLLTEAPQSLRLVYRYYPMIHQNDKAAQAVQAAEAASNQGKFWQMHDALFAGQVKWNSLSAAEFDKYLANLANSLSLDKARFEADRASSELAGIPPKAFDQGFKIGIPHTPFLLINGQMYTGPNDFTSLKYIVNLIALGEKQFTACPEIVIDAEKLYFARLKTAKGEAVIKLYADKVPNTVNNFVFLARQGWFDGITFHRVVPGVLAQTGDPSGTGAGNPGYFFKNEIVPELIYDRPGLVGMANSGLDTNGSQFFIAFKAIPEFNGIYTIFGEVTSGLEVLQSLAARNPQPGQVLADGDLLISVTIEERE